MPPEKNMPESIDNGEDSDDESSEVSFIMETIDEAGDVTLNLPMNEHHQIRVSSKLLSVASPVFAAMFNGRFSGGRDLSTTTSRIIDLPEDDGPSMCLLCKLLYHQPADTEIHLCNAEEKSGALVQLAVVAKKYMCTQIIQTTMKYVIFTELHKKEKIQNIDVWFNLLAIAYTLDHHELFWETSQQVVRLLCDGEVLQLINSIPVVTSLIPPEITTYLECRRSSLQKYLLPKLKEQLEKKNLTDHDPLIWHVLDRKCNTSDISQRIAPILTLLEKWFFKGLSIRGFCQSAYDDLRVVVDNYGTEEGPKRLTPKQVAFANVVHVQIKSYAEVYGGNKHSGLCLECFKSQDEINSTCSGYRHLGANVRKRDFGRYNESDIEASRTPRRFNPIVRLKIAYPRS